MASANRGQPEAAERQLPIPDSPEVPSGDEDEPERPQLAILDGGEVPGGGEQMPEHLIIGTKQAFD